MSNEGKKLTGPKIRMINQRIRREIDKLDDIAIALYNGGYIDKIDELQAIEYLLADFLRSMMKYE